jgi:hypothetical protein
MTSPGRREPDASAGAVATGRAPRVRHELLLVAALGLGCWLLFVANCRVIATNDSLGTALAPFALWAGDGLVLDAFLRDEEIQGLYCFTRDARGHWRNAFPSGTTLLAAPLYFPLLFAGDLDPLEPRFLPIARVAEKYAGATLATAAVLALYSLLRRSLERPAAALGALAFALGTPVWSVASQALWQHAPAALALALGLRLLLVDEPRVGTSAAAGLATALLVAVRPPDAIFAAALAGIALRRPSRAVAVPFFAASGAGGLALIAYNLGSFGSLSGGYSVFAHQFGFSFRSLLGLLVSSQGLLVYCPFLLFLVRPGRLPRGVDRVDATLLGASWLATLGLYSSYSPWWGGEHFGARFLIDGLPILFFLGGAAWTIPRLGPRQVAQFAALGLAIGIQAVGAFYFPAGDSRRVANTEPRFFSVRGSLPWLAFQAGAPAAQLKPLAHRAGANVGDGGLDVRLGFASIPPALWRAGSWHPVEFEIENRSARRIVTRGWYGAQGAARLVVVWRGVRASFQEVSEFGLRGDLEGGVRRHLVHQLVAPTSAGRYLLEAMLIEKDDWGGRILARAGPRTVRVSDQPPPVHDTSKILFLEDFEGGDLGAWIAGDDDASAAEASGANR